MAAASGKNYGVGMRHAVIFELNSSGSPNAANATTIYEGVQLVGAKAFTLTIPDARKFTHVGDDRPLQVDYLPPNEAASAELTVAQENLDALAILTGVTKFSQGEASMIGLGTDNQGSEPQVGLLLYQQSLDETGTRNYRFFLMPKATIYPRPSGMSDAAAEHVFTVSPAVVTKHLWERAFADGTEGMAEAQVLVGHSYYKPKVVAWLGDNTTTAFLFPTAKPAQAVAKISVFVDGVLDTGVTKATTGFETGTAYTTNKRIVCFYEHT